MDTLSTTFLMALLTIIIIDLVLGVAGAANGGFLLVVLGLLISVPIVVWGSTLVLKWVNRFPSIISIGCGILILTATQTILDEKLLAPYLPAHTWFGELSGAILTAALLAAFMYRQQQNQRAPVKMIGQTANSNV